jgi:hypothetical protein
VGLRGKAPDSSRDIPRSTPVSGSSSRGTGTSCSTRSEPPASKDAYSPISLHFNFPHNALVATVALALVGANETNLPLDAFLTPTEPGQTSTKPSFCWPEP